MLDLTCDSVYARRPDWAHGSVSLADAQYLFDRVGEVKPASVVEIGTASGVSTAILCAALHAVRNGDGYAVVSYDANTNFYADPSKALGEAATAMLPAELLEHVELRHPATAMHVREQHGDNTLQFVFIDANHSHPWPALDLLALLPVLKVGAEVALHDINLPILHPQWRAWGAKHLFDDLDIEKHVEQKQGNVGSVIVPADKDALRRQLIDIVHRYPWQVELPETFTAQLL